MTPEDIRAIEEARERREDEYILLLLLLLGWSAWKSGLVTTEAAKELFDYDAPGPNTAGPTAIATVSEFRRLFAGRATNEIAESMADMHRDAFPIYRAGLLFADNPAELVRLYMPSAREATDAMLDTIAKAIAEAGGDVAKGVDAAGYSRFNTNGLELGAERNMVTASNAGLLSAAFADGEGGTITALEHLSVLDDVTTPICQERARLVLPVGDRYWLRNWPSLHWNCRSIIRPLTGEFTASRILPTEPPMPGFGIAPPVVVALLERAARGSRGVAA